MFSGFTKETVDFMWGIRFNNNKAWFELHKKEYHDFLEGPMKELAGEVSSALRAAEPERDMAPRVSRIYRDARRLFGRGPYKDHLWFTLRGADCDMWTDRPSFWFELGPELWSYGLGYYMAKPMTMAKHRARLRKSPAGLLALDAMLREQNEFVLEGESYKKPKGGGEGPLARWYNLRTFSLIHEEPLSGAITECALSKRISDGFAFLIPFYDYFCALDADPEPEE